MTQITIVNACIYAYPGQVEAGNITFSQALNEPIKIQSWNVEGISQPTDEELIDLMSQYESQFESDSIKKEAKYAIMDHLDKIAQSKDYNSSLSCSSFSNSTVSQWKNEASIFIEWRDAVWSYAFQQFDLIQQKQRTIPTIDEFIQELPVIDWNKII